MLTDSGNIQILFAGCDTTLYIYVGNDPVNGIDPEGKILLHLTLKLANWYRKNYMPFGPNKEEHTNRNKHNICPKKEPQCEPQDEGWRTGMFDIKHGDKWRYSDGSECAYDENGNFIPGEGTFNYSPYMGEEEWKNPAHIYKDWASHFYYGGDSAYVTPDQTTTPCWSRVPTLVLNNPAMV